MQQKCQGIHPKIPHRPQKRGEGGEKQHTAAHRPQQLRLYLLLGEKPSARGALGASYAAEALAGEEDLVVEGADWAEETQRLTVYLRWQGAPLQAAVQL